MRIERVVTALSWIPSEAIEGSAKIPFVMGVGRYDDPPPALLDSLDELHARGAFRFANELRAWVDVQDGEIVDRGFSGRSLLSDTHFKLGPVEMTFATDRVPDPPVGHRCHRGLDHLRADRRGTPGNAGAPHRARALRSCR